MDLYGEALRSIILEVQTSRVNNPRKLRAILARHPRRPALDGRTLFNKHELVGAYRLLCDQGLLEFQLDTLRRLQMKPMRTSSGVAPVTVLTKPHPCPGDCIFCPSDDRMPKSYLADEPGAMRAAYHGFDPYEQTAARLRALENIGHPTDKIELLILGGTWDAYPRDYQSWFIQRCLEAMNGEESPNLHDAQVNNEIAEHRNVGLVIETRPDRITPDELAWLAVDLKAIDRDTPVLLFLHANMAEDDTQRIVELLAIHIPRHISGPQAFLGI